MTEAIWVKSTFDIPIEGSFEKFVAHVVRASVSLSCFYNGKPYLSKLEHFTRKRYSLFRLNHFTVSVWKRTTTG